MTVCVRAKRLHHRRPGGVVAPEAVEQQEGGARSHPDVRASVAVHDDVLDVRARDGARDLPAFCGRDRSRIQPEGRSRVGVAPRDDAKS